MCVFKNSIQVYKKKMLIIFIIKEKLGCHNLCVLYFSLGNVHIELLVLFVSCNVLLTKNTVQCSVSNVHNELRNILEFRKIYVMKYLFPMGSSFRVSEFADWIFSWSFESFTNNRSMQIYASDSWTFLLWGWRFKTLMELEKTLLHQLWSLLGQL